MEVYWLEQREADVAADDDWLSAGERRRLDGLRFPKRRADWRLGRWTAKCAVAACLGEQIDPAEIEVRAAASGAPEVFRAGRPMGVEISLSHCAGVACCAVADRAGAIGCDLERIEPRSAAFVADYFTAEEQNRIGQAAHSERDALVTLLWSAKESALKALRVGLRVDTRSVAVHHMGPRTSGWAPLMVSCPAVELCGWWRSDEFLVRTVIGGSAESALSDLRAAGSRLQFDFRCVGRPQSIGH